MRQKWLSFVLLASVLPMAFPFAVAAAEVGAAAPVLGPHQNASILSRSLQPDKPYDYYQPSQHQLYITVTSYNSEPGQTDSTPFITAFGTEVRDGIVATNYLPRGTKIRFPDIYGSKIFIVEDRMNIRYFKRMDIWMEDKDVSKQFGARTLRMEIVK